MSGMGLPIIRIELDSVRYAVSQMLSDKNNEMNKMIIDSLNMQLTEEWIQTEINTAIRKCLEDSIRQVALSYELKNAISSLIAEAVSKMVKASS